MVEVARQQSCETSGEPQRLFVREPAEHDVGHHRELLLYGTLDMRMVVAVAHCPPRCDPVDEFASVGEKDSRTVRPNHRQWRIGGFHLRVRQPEMFYPTLVPIRTSHRGFS